MMGESLRRKPEFEPGAVHTQAWRRFVVAALLTSSTPVLAQPTTPAQPNPAEAAAAEAAPPAAPLAASGAGEAALDERAQRHWGSGMAYLDEDDYTKALEAFEKAYELSGRPRILLAIAVTHERRGDLGQAIVTLDEYLRLAPTADNAESIRAHRDELQAKHDQQLQEMSEAKKDERVIAGPVIPDGEDGDFQASGAQAVPTSDAQERRRSTLRWTAFGVGVASGVAATVSGLLTMKKYDELQERCDVGLCSRQDTRTGRTMAWVSTALTGVAVVGLGVGLWLTFDDPADTPNAESARQLRVGLAYRPSGLTSEVSWSF